MPRALPLAERMAARVDKRPDGCWLWRGSCFDSGYGAVKVNGQQKKAHRVAYELAHGPIPDGLLVLHRCDTKACVNVDHLYLGTRSENARDCFARGQLGRGERSPRARLTEALVVEARERYAAGEQITAMAREYGVPNTTLSSAVRGRSWQVLRGPAAPTTLGLISGECVDCWHRWVHHGAEGCRAPGCRCTETAQ